MTIANVLQVFLLILGVMLVFQAYWLAATALFPKTINNARDRYKKPFTTTLVGLAIVVPTFLVGFVLLGNLPNPLIMISGFGRLPSNTKPTRNVGTTMAKPTSVVVNGFL